jgi:hypothetical protein
MELEGRVRDLKETIEHGDARSRILIAPSPADDQ